MLQYLTTNAGNPCVWVPATLIVLAVVSVVNKILTRGV